MPNDSANLGVTGWISTPSQPRETRPLVRSWSATFMATSIVIANGGETALYLGDVVQHEVQLERVAWISAFDILPLVSLETKKRLVHEAITTGQLVVCVHSTFPGVGRLVNIDGRTKFEPEAPHG